MGWKVMLAGVLVLLAAVAQISAATGENSSLPGCKDKCGNISIPYPFGIGRGCFRKGFSLSCNDALNPPKLIVGNVEVADVFLSGELRVKIAISGVDCYNKAGVNISTNRGFTMNSGPFTFSHTKNKFTVVGCDTEAVIEGTMRVEYRFGCRTYCGASLEDFTNGTCSGMGCCQLSIPRGLKNYNSSLSSTYNYNQSWEFNRCGYSFMSEEDKYNFSTTDLNDGDFFRRRYPIMLDWSIGNQTCKQLMESNSSAGACRSENSKCVESLNGVGYLCNCADGYEGNPYLVGGCQDIDECNDNRYPCNGTCENTPGSYNCSCPEGTTSPNPKLEPCDIPISMGERTPPATSLRTKLGIGIGAGFLLLLTTGSWAYLGFQKRRFLLLKHKFFQQNGGLFLRQCISTHRGGAGFRIFSEAELSQATNNFDDAQVLGRGGHGTVYKGTMDDGRLVAIKRSRTVDERQSKEFAREMLILSQINHRNIVKLLGCCLEVEVPMLVYECVPNGTLFDSIHYKKHPHTSSLDTRLRIAVEAAEALAYLHCYASPPILHGDVKSSNILLDDDYVAKVSDFGASILAPLDKEQLATVVQGTCGYLDPEYLVTCRLTEKSDVYSFGVVMVELLTGKKAFHFSAPEGERSLAMSFVSAFKENRLVQILEIQLKDGEEMKKLQEVAELANQCLRLRGEERPTMKEVTLLLQGLRGSKQHPWVPHNPEEAESLLSEAAGPYNGDTTQYFSFRNRAILQVEAGR